MLCRLTSRLFECFWILVDGNHATHSLHTASNQERKNGQGELHGEHQGKQLKMEKASMFSPSCGCPHRRAHHGRPLDSAPHAPQRFEMSNHFGHRCNRSIHIFRVWLQLYHGSKNNSTHRHPKAYRLYQQRRLEGYALDVWMVGD